MLSDISQVSVKLHYKPGSFAKLPLRAGLHPWMEFRKKNEKKSPLPQIQINSSLQNKKGVGSGLS